jgi:hypothetical protein
MPALVERAVALVLLLALPLAAAQEPDPTVNDSDFDNSTPPADDSYLNDPSNDTTQADPSVNDSDFDTSVPTADTSYLDDAEASKDAASTQPSSTGSKVPGTGAAGVLVVAALLGIALEMRRR